MSEAILATNTMRTQVTEFHQANRRLPNADEAARFAAGPQSKFVRSVVWEPDRRAIVVTMHEPFPGKRFALTFVEQDGQIARVRCGPIDIDPKQLPGACRD